MQLSILDNAAKDIEGFNKIGLHYEIVSNAIHMKRATEDLFSPEFIRYIIAGLISFDMERMMGKNKYSFESGFAARLSQKLQQVRPMVEPLLDQNIMDTNLKNYRNNIIETVNILSSRGPSCLHSNQNNYFHVGAYKILHFLNPELFIIIDSNATRVFRKYLDIGFKKSTQPGYSPERYFECMQRVQVEIFKYGTDRFRILEPGVPITRIFDKITFIKGSKLK